MINDKPMNAALPIQKVSNKVKFELDKDKFGHTRWMKDCMDSLESLGLMFRRADEQTRRNYRIVNGQFDIRDYEKQEEISDFVTAMTEENKLPSHIKNYDMSSKIIKILVSQYVSRPDLMSVLVNDRFTENERMRTRTQLMRGWMQNQLQESIAKQFQAAGIDPNQQDFESEEEMQQFKQLIEEKYKEFTPENIDLFMSYDYKTAGEEVAHIVLQNLINDKDLKKSNVQEFSESIITSSCYSHITRNTKGVVLETWLRKHMFHPLNSVITKTEDMPYVGRQYVMSKASCIDRFGTRMLQEQIDALYPDVEGVARSGGVAEGLMQTSVVPFGDYLDFRRIRQASWSAIDTDGITSEFGQDYAYLQGDLVRVTETYWSSYILVGLLTIRNPETGQLETHFVDEKTKLSSLGITEIKNKTPLEVLDSPEENTVVWTWVKQVWQGIKLNTVIEGKYASEQERSGIYVDIKPCDFQFRGNTIEELFDAKIPVVGGLVNAGTGFPNNPIATSTPFAMLYNIIMNLSYSKFQLTNGKVLLLGKSLLQNEKDLGGEGAFEKFIDMARGVGAVAVNDNPQAANGMQYSRVIDMDETDSILRMYNAAQWLEQQAMANVGIYPNQEQGQVAGVDKAGNPISNTPSYAVNEIYFDLFGDYVERKMNMALNYSLWLYSQDKEFSLNYQMPDMAKGFIAATGDDLILLNATAKLVVDSKQLRNKELVNEFILKNNQGLIPIADALDTIISDNPTLAVKKIRKAQADMQASQSQEAQANRESAEKIAQLKSDDEAKGRELKWQIAELEAQTKLRDSTIKAIGNEGSFDPNKDTLSQVIAERDLSLKEMDIKDSNTILKMKQANEVLATIKNSEHQDKKLSSQEKLAKEKLKAGIEKERIKNQGIDKQNKSQEKEAKLIFDRDVLLKKMDLEIKEKELKSKSSKEKK